jgi:NitT/TauT family transport system permease protein
MSGSKGKRIFIGSIVPPLITLAAVTLVWEITVRWRDAVAGGGYHLPLPLPSGMMHTLWVERGEMLAALWTTTQGALLGFAASAVLGGLSAVILSTSSWVRRAVYPYTLFFQTVPVIAIAPMLEIWSGAGLRAVVIMAFIVSVFPVIAATLGGLLGTDPALEDLFRLYGSGPVARLWKLRLPSALPSLLIGLRVAAGLSVIGTVVAEFFVGSYGIDEGLGVKIVSDAKYGHTNAVFAGVLLASLLGLAMFACVNAAGHLLLRRWHPSGA